MSTITSVRVPESLQTLIDSRLDTIDRMLLGRLPRGERLEVVREVESQVFEHLQERAGGEELSREDVLDALRRLDPPEAYLPEEFGAEASQRVRVAASRPAMSLSPAGPIAARPRTQVGLAGGILGIVTLVAILLQWPLIIALAQIFSSNATLIYV